MTIEQLKAASTTKPIMLAGAIAGILRSGNVADIVAIGAGAVNQAVKAVAIARGYLTPNGIEIVSLPSFLDLEDPSSEDGLRTAIKIRVEKR